MAVKSDKPAQSNSKVRELPEQMGSQPRYAPSRTRNIGQQQYVSQQPTSSPQMFTDRSGGDRNALDKSFNAHGKREWSFGLCDCLNERRTCLFSSCCPCCVFGENISRLTYLQSGHQSAKYWSCNLRCCLCLACNPCSMDGRTKIRDRYHIDGNRFTDCLSHTFCIPCALTQESREIALEEGNLAVPRLEMGSIRKVFDFLWSSCVSGFSWVVHFLSSLCVSVYGICKCFLGVCFEICKWFLEVCFEICKFFLGACTLLFLYCLVGDAVTVLA